MMTAWYKELQGAWLTSTSASMMQTASASPCWKGRPSGRTSTTPMSYLWVGDLDEVCGLRLQLDEAPLLDGRALEVHDVALVQVHVLHHPKGEVDHALLYACQ